MTDHLTSDGIPVFGRGADHVSTVEFAIEIYDIKAGTTDDVRFRALQDPGGGPIVSFMRSHADGGDGVIQAAAGLIMRAAIDTDGLSADYVRPPEGSDEDLDPRYDEIPEWSSKRRFIYYVDSQNHHIGKDVINELALYVAKQALNRSPTKAPKAGASPSASSPGRTPTRRGSTASRPRRA